MGRRRRREERDNEREIEENVGGSMGDGLSFNRTFWSFYRAIFSENY